MKRHVVLVALTANYQTDFDAEKVIMIEM